MSNRPSWCGAERPDGLKNVTHGHWNRHTGKTAARKRGLIAARVEAMNKQREIKAKMEAKKDSKGRVRKFLEKLFKKTRKEE